MQANLRKVFFTLAGHNLYGERDLANGEEKKEYEEKGGFQYYVIHKKMQLSVLHNMQIKKNTVFSIT